MPTPEELHRRGVDALNRGRHASARRYLERALQGAEDSDLLGRIEGSLAYVLSETGDAVAALELCRSALERPRLARDTRAVLNRQIALVQMLRGEGDEAIAAFGRAIRLTDDDMGRGLIHLNRGNVHLQREELEVAGADFEEAERSFLAAGDAYAAAKAVHNLGYVHLLAGDLVAALRRMDEAYETVASESPVMRAMVEQDRAEALIAAGLVDEGVASLHAAAAAYARRRLYQRQGEAELARARTSATRGSRGRRRARRGRGSAGARPTAGSHGPRPRSSPQTSGRAGCAPLSRAATGSLRSWMRRSRGGTRWPSGST